MLWVLAVFLIALFVARGRGALEPRVAGELAEQDPGRAQVRARLISPLKTEQRGWRAMAQAEKGQKFVADFPKSLGVTGIPLVGDEVLLRGRLRLGREPRNPGDFDERGYLADRGVAWLLDVDAVEPLGTATWDLKPWRWAEEARRFLERTFEEFLGPVDGRLMAGLTLGDKGPLPRALNRQIQDAGVMHLLVASGAKVALVMAAAAGLGWVLAWPPWTRWGVCAAAGGFYTVMVGAEPPYARACWCFLLLGAGMASGRELAALQALTLAALAILIRQPRDAFSLGFQMTFAATAALLAAFARIERLVAGFPRAAGRCAWALLAGAVVQVSLWPLLAQAFGRVSLVAVAANAVLVPVAPLIASCGFLMAGLKVCGLVGAARAAARPTALLLDFFCRACGFFASCPWAAAEAAPWSGGAVALYYAALFCALLLPARKAAAAIAVCACLWGACAATRRFREAPVELICLSLPRGDAALVRVHGAWWVAEAGAPAGPILKALKAEGLPALSRIVHDGAPGSLRALPRLTAYAPEAVVERRAPLEWSEKNARFSLWPARVRMGRSEFSIILLHRRRFAEAISDGINVEIREQGHSFGRSLL